MSEKTKHKVRKMKKEVKKTENYCFNGNYSNLEVLCDAIAPLKRQNGMNDKDII